jgi:hypothetical protein
MFSRLTIRTFQLVFLAGTMFSLTKNQSEECFNLFFSISERAIDTRKSTTGVLFFFGSCPVTWQS